jgi:hypothetical protein
MGLALVSHELWQMKNNGRESHLLVDDGTVSNHERSPGNLNLSRKFRPTAFFLLIVDRSTQ